MLSARSEELDRVRGLETGADDYVINPYSIAEVMARSAMTSAIGSAGGSAKPPSLPDKPTPDGVCLPAEAWCAELRNEAYRRMYTEQEA